MHHLFRLIANASTSNRFAAPETARTRRASQLAAALLIGPLTLSGYVTAAPTGGKVTTGSGQITQSGTTTTIQQNSQTLGLDWLSFNVAANETVNFVQPGQNSIAVNQILSSSGSEILGHLHANGQVWLINPNGILFGADAQVNVAGLVASTLAPTAANGTGGTSFSGSGTGSIVNQGTITAAKGGYVALLGNSVSNQGVVSAQLGTVALGAGSAETLTFAGNKLLQIAVDQSTLAALAENKGLIAAPGGAVYMTAGAANSLLASTVNTSGVIRATSFADHDGTIVLSAGLPAGTVTVGGLLDVSSSHGAGGDATATAGSVVVGPNATIDAAGGAGGGSIRIGGGWEGGEGLAQATTVNVVGGATLDATATNKGNGGEIVVRSDVTNMNSTAEVAGTLLATGGPLGGNGGHIETSGHWLDVTGITVNTAATSGAPGTWLLDPYNVTIGSTGTNISTSGGTYTPTATSTITASSIATALNGGNNVTISTYNSGGGSIGDITVSSAITKTSGNANVLLTLQAADTIAINAPISNTGGTGKLNVNLYADNDNGVHDGVGVVILNNSITTGGGYINFGTGATMSVNSVTTQVGGDVYVGGGSAVNLTTAGGAVAINGALIIGNPSGLNIDTTNGVNTAGNVLFGGTIDSGDTYALISSYGSVTWNAALADAKSGVGSATGDTYLATITSRLENAVASYDVNYTNSWLGAERVFGLNTDAVWRWVAGPEGLTNNGEGLPFFTQNGCDTNNCGVAGSATFRSGAAINGAYKNWNPATPEPNDYNGTSLNQAGSGEWVMEFVGTQGQWNDFNPTSNHLPFTQETNLAPSPLSVNAGTTGTVTFTGAIGSSKPLATLNVTGQILGLPTNPSITTTGPVNLNGQVKIGGVDSNVLVVSAPDVTTTYRSVLPTFTATYSGFIAGDTAASLTTAPTLTTTGNTAYISTAPITASGAADATNPTRYFFIYDPGLLTVDPAPLTVAGTTVTTRAYNGLTTATLTGGTLSGLFNADNGNVTLTQAGVFTSKNAGSSIPVTLSDTISGSAAGDYTFTAPTNVTGTITPLALNVSGSSVSQKTYDGTTTATLTGGSLSGVLSADLPYVSLAAQLGTFATKNAGSGIAVTAADSITASGPAAGDYTIAQPTGLTGTITPKPITVNGSTGVNKTYDATTVLPSGVTGYVTSTGFISGDAVSVTGVAAYGAADAGSRALLQGTVNFTGSAAGNYALSWVNGAGTISPAQLTITANADARFVGLSDTAGYNGVSYQGFVGGQNSGVLGGALAVTRSNADVAAGVYPGVLVPAGQTSTNYTITFVPGAYTIVPAGELLERATNISTTYGSVPNYAITSVQYLDGSNTLVTLSPTGVPGSYSDGVGGTATFTLGANGAVMSGGGNLAAGNYAIANAAFASTGGNFNNTPVVVGEVSVNPLGITATAANPPSKTYDGTTSMSGTSISLSGVLTGDAVTGSGVGSFTTKDAGTGLQYSLNGLGLTGADSQDYYLTSRSVTGNNGTITPLALTVSGTLVTAKTYDGMTAATLTGGTLNGVLSADQQYVSLAAQSGTFAVKDAGSGIAVTAADSITASGPAAGDYTLIQPTGLTGTITPLALAVSGSAVTAKTYDGTTTATLTGGTLSGVLSADQSYVSLTQSGAFASKNAGSGIAVTATDILSATGPAAGDYRLSEPTSLTGTITPRSVTLNNDETAASKTYDGTTAATLSGGPLNNMLAGDSGGLSLTGTFASPNAGQHIAVTVALSGSDAGNYVLGGTPTLAADIDPAQLLATANPLVTQPGTVLPTLSGTFSGLVGGQTLAGLEADGYHASWNSTVSGGSAAGHYAITGSFSDGNYSVVQAASNATAFDVALAAAPVALAAAPAGSSSGSEINALASLPNASSTAYSAGTVPSGSSSLPGSATGTDSTTAVAEGADSSSTILAGTSTSTGNGAGQSVEANSTDTATDGTVTLSARGAGGAGLGGGGANSAVPAGASNTGAAGPGGSATTGTKDESLGDLGGRRLIVVSGGVNSALAH